MERAAVRPAVVERGRPCTDIRPFEDEEDHGMRFVSALDDIVPYEPGRPIERVQREFHLERVVKLASNEYPLPPFPEVREAIVAALDGLQRYPDGHTADLRAALGQKYHRAPDEITIGNGSCELILYLGNALLEPGDEVVFAQPSFSLYPTTCLLHRARPTTVPLNDFRHELDAMLAAIGPRTRMVIVCNPNNPTGTYWNEQKLRRFLDRVDGQQIVVVDEAYAEFVEAEDFPNSMTMINEYPNLVVFRTFSKMFALAALRVGYLVGHEKIVDIIRRTCVVYSVNTLAQLAAIASLTDADEHIERTRRIVSEARQFLREELTKAGLFFLGGEGNFMVIRLPISDTLAYRKLMRSGIMVRTMTGFRFPNHIRVTLGTIPVMEKFIAALRPIVAG